VPRLRGAFAAIVLVAATVVMVAPASASPLAAGGGPDQQSGKTHQDDQSARAHRSAHGDGKVDHRADHPERPQKETAAGACRNPKADEGTSCGTKPPPAPTPTPPVVGPSVTPTPAVTPAAAVIPAATVAPAAPAVTVPPVVVAVPPPARRFVGPSPPAPTPVRRASPFAPAPSRPLASIGPIPGLTTLTPEVLRTATHLKIPLALAGLIVLFLIVQTRIDRQDPKLARAPTNADDDALSFGE
jgi:hypothetical protein